jgi:hypothetical protein
MKKIIAFIFMTSLLFAQTERDIAFTTGYNKFDDPEYLRNGRFFFGIRGGVYQDNGYGFQLGYEQANGANCQGLNLKRIYTNALMISKQPNGLNPYGLLSAGYEMSNIHDHKPDQTFIGIGAGLRKSLTPNVNGFVETRVLRKLKSDDTDIITTLGLAYALDSRAPEYREQREVYSSVPQPAANSIVVNGEYELHRPQSVVPNAEPYTPPYTEPVVVDTQKHYYVQMVALATTSPEPYLQKLYARGIDNAQVKEVNIRGRALSLVVVGPFYDRREAVQNLRKLKRVSRGAFITKF